MATGPMTRRWLIVLAVAVVVMLIAGLIYVAFAHQDGRSEEDRSGPDRVSATAPPYRPLLLPIPLRFG